MRYVEKYNLKVDEYGEAFTVDDKPVPLYENEFGFPEYPFKSSKGQLRRVTRQMLTATAYIDNPHNAKRVYYKDGNKNNTHYTNMDWLVGHAKAGKPRPSRCRANRDEEGI